jgi:hypothetical protein
MAVIWMSRRLPRCGSGPPVALQSVKLASPRNWQNVARISENRAVQNGLLDGHNRYELCTKHNIPYRTVEVSLPDMHAAKSWMIDNQLGRRNLTEGQMSYLRGERYKLEKQGVGRPERQCGQNDHNSERTVEKLSAQYRRSPKTIQRDAAYASDINKIAAVADTQGARIVMETEGWQLACIGAIMEGNPSSEGRQGQDVLSGDIGVLAFALPYTRLRPRVSQRWFSSLSTFPYSPYIRHSLSNALRRHFRHAPAPLCDRPPITCLPSGLLRLPVKVKTSHEGPSKTSGRFLAVRRPAGGGAMSSRLIGRTRAVSAHYPPP